MFKLQIVVAFFLGGSDGQGFSGTFHVFSDPKWGAREPQNRPISIGSLVLGGFCDKISCRLLSTKRESKGTGIKLLRPPFCKVILRGSPQNTTNPPHFQQMRLGGGDICFFQSYMGRKHLNRQKS